MQTKPSPIQKKTSTATDASATTAKPTGRTLRKQCRSCGRELPVSEFYRQRGCRERHRVDCKACARAACGRVTRRRRKRLHEALAAEQKNATPMGRGRRLLCGGCGLRQPPERYSADARFCTGLRRLCAECTQRQEKKAASGDLNQPDAVMAEKSRLRQRRIDLGLAIAEATCPPGHGRTYEELAAFTGLTEAGVRGIEQRALAKLRKRAMELLLKCDLTEVLEEMP